MDVKCNFWPTFYTSRKTHVLRLHDLFPNEIKKKKKIVIV